jgi:hypothetical protein
MAEGSHTRRRSNQTINPGVKREKENQSQANPAPRGLSDFLSVVAVSIRRARAGPKAGGSRSLFRTRGGHTERVARDRSQRRRVVDRPAEAAYPEGLSRTKMSETVAGPNMAKVAYVSDASDAKARASAMHKRGLISDAELASLHKKANKVIGHGKSEKR